MQARLPLIHRAEVRFWCCFVEPYVGVTDSESVQRNSKVRINMDDVVVPRAMLRVHFILALSFARLHGYRA